MSTTIVQTSPEIAPGSYNLIQYGDFSEKNLQKRMEGPNWETALNTETLAKIPHSSYRKTYDQIREDQRRIGPGYYEVNDFITEADRRPRCARGALDQLSPRFPKESFVCESLFFCLL